VEPPLVPSEAALAPVRSKRESGKHVQACHFPEIKTDLVAEVEHSA
jgi:peptide/nickel transport system ATP-binding protein